MNCGLLGRHLQHSYSAQIHRHLGSYAYKLFEIEPNELENFLKNGDFQGINVTIPYKKSVIPYLDELSPVASQLGAVNTIVRTAEGRLIGHNTDYFGFRYMVEKSGLTLKNKKVLVLGSGGASSTVEAVLKELQAEAVVISRSGENNYSNLDRHKDCAVLVNTTPVGMFPDNGVSPVKLSQFPHLEGVLDVIYNPSRTQLLLEGEKSGIVTMNGLWMLVAQALESACWFTNSCISQDRIPQIHSILSRQMQNIILIGMPGCGKSTVGKELSRILGRKFADADSVIEERSCVSIPQIFATKGEDSFRQLETAVLSDLGKGSSLVISTGGGCVTREENYALLHQNGVIFWLKRDLDLLPTDGRPLSQANPLAELYQKRLPLYRSFADAEVDNNNEVGDCVAEILKILEEKYENFGD